jgi:hypothetical protein
MSAISIGGENHGAALTRVAADWLGLAAAPAFAAMALMTASEAAPSRSAQRMARS